MRTFVLVALVACMAIVFVEVAQVNAQGGNRRCRNKPPLRPAKDVECDRRQRPVLKALACRRECRACYERNELSRRRESCLVGGDCVCLGKGGEGNSTTTANPTEEPSTSVNPSTEEPSTSVNPSTEEPSTSVNPSTEEPSSSVNPSTEVPSTSAEPEPSTTAAGEETTLPE